MTSNRNLIIIVVAVILMIAVLGCAVFVTVSGLAEREKFDVNTIWKAPIGGALSVNVTDLTGDGERDVFAQTERSFSVLDSGGQIIFEKGYDQPIATTQGDVNGDSVPDIVVFSWDGAQAHITAFTGQGDVLWDDSLPNVTVPSRIVTLDFENDRRNELVVGDLSGQLIALSEERAISWDYSDLFGSNLRGLDELQTPAGDIVVGGDENGSVVAINRAGEILWTAEAPFGLRRLRAFPIGGPLQGRVLVGGVDGVLTVYDGNGQALWNTNVGQAVNETRPVEIDGDPATTEILVGGKDGGVWAFSQDGQRLWSDSMSEKVNEVVWFNSEAAGGPVVVVGDDNGSVKMYRADGSTLTSFSVSGLVSRLDVGKLGDVSGFLVADSSGLTLHTLEAVSAPFWYSPILAGVIACGVIAVVAYVIAQIKPAPTLRVTAAEMSVEAQRARRRMLHESIDDLQQIRDRGEVTGESYLARLKELRGQLAEVNGALITLGEPIKVETFACPHCGGSLNLGSDRCEFCGQVVIV